MADESIWGVWDVEDVEVRFRVEGVQEGAEYVVRRWNAEERAGGVQRHTTLGFVFFPRELSRVLSCISSLPPRSLQCQQSRAESEQRGTACRSKSNRPSWHADAYGLNASAAPYKPNASRWYESAYPLTMVGHGGTKEGLRWARNVV